MSSLSLFIMLHVTICLYSWKVPTRAAKADARAKRHTANVEAANSDKPHNFHKPGERSKAESEAHARHDVAVAEIGKMPSMVFNWKVFKGQRNCASKNCVVDCECR